MPFAGIQPGVSPLTQFIERLKGPQSLGMTIGGGDHNFNSIGDFLMGELNRALNAPGAEVFPAVGPMALETVLAKGFAPSSSAITQAIRLLRSSGKTGITAETPKLGSMLEQALIETNPANTTFSRRIPSIGNLITGKIARGTPGGYHEVAGGTLGPRGFRINEMPDYVTFEGFQGMSPNDVPKMVQLLQSLGKPVVVPDAPLFGKYAGGLF